VSATREIKLSSVCRLHRNKRNSRTHSKKQIRQIANSIRRFGWTYPILTDENNIILAGHGRYDAALQLGLREVPIIVLGSMTRKSARWPWPTTRSLRRQAGIVSCLRRSWAN
jgi:ParB-like chromosome segregation protein Spo0J